MNPSINKYSMHVFMFVFYISNASFVPFLSYWFSQKGLSNQQIGFLYSLGPLIGLAAQTVWGYLSDRYGIGKRLLMVSLMLTPIVTFGYLLGKERFYMYIIVSAVYFFLSLAVRPNMEEITLSHARANGQSYGGIRVLGSVSFALTVTPLGIMYNHLGINMIFVTYLVTSLIALLALLQVKPSSEGKKAKTNAMAAGFRQLATNRYFVVFLLSAFLIGLANGFNMVFFPLLVNKLGGEVAQELGVLSTVSALSELPLFILSAYLLRRFGYFNVLAFCAGAATLRWFVLSLEPTFQLLFMSQMLHGITFGLYTAAAVNFIYEMSPGGLKATGQTIFAIIAGSLASLIASSSGGWIIDHYDFNVLYTIGSVLALISSCIFIGMSIIHKKSSQGLRNKKTLNLT
ncbi:MFS transporter [Paenibacillus sp. OV219]|uniref:MFS transporter n=1 Tax=Paenibacillus sp. OV219 TaxID=1884377 RepID=UPI0008CC31BE|nr:MFS transporter [Paenibacillus sp. OV219]SEN48973.1 MFS transporter, PPP family, 3-phenylpropionic acid transporter [Paenibacillus sp. OV219]